MINKDTAAAIAIEHYHRKYEDTEDTQFSTQYVNEQAASDSIAVGLLARKEGEDLKMFTIDIPMWHYQAHVQKIREGRIDEILT
jgi:hypothetical protein